MKPRKTPGGLLFTTDIGRNVIYPFLVESDHTSNPLAWREMWSDEKGHHGAIAHIVAGNALVGEQVLSAKYYPHLDGAQYAWDNP